MNELANCGYGALEILVALHASEPGVNRFPVGRYTSVGAGRVFGRLQAAGYITLTGPCWAVLTEAGKAALRSSGREAE